MAKSFDNLDGRGTIDGFLARQRQAITQASAMADQKASISLALQLGLLTLIVHQFADSGHGAVTLGRVWWLAPLGVATLISVVLCLYVLMPSIGSSMPWKPRILPSSRNPLFFSSIAQFTEEEYLEELGQLFQSDWKIYEATVIDMHRECTVLHKKKYRFLQLAYQSFLLGILLTAFCVVVKMCIS
jgi:hypothetical protein